ncbi:hypothetical protein AK830_g2379 [Neonectria ditissima]|uniref:Uncharacterized protein n=1 Tax=Neonectria ditissima TaxID=78410 RepID=A0A0P7BUI6_9HYPO|nr:hypothetical protein AK830_g2379 [Neonectria ditissima]
MDDRPKLCKMTPEDSKQFWDNFPIDGLSHWDEGHEALSRNLGYVPMAMELAAAYTTKTGLSIPGYMKLLEATEAKAAMKDVQTGDVHSTQLEAAAKAWSVSFHYILKNDTAAFDVLSFLSCPNPMGVSTSLLPQSALLQVGIDTLVSFRLTWLDPGKSYLSMYDATHTLTKNGIRRIGEDFEEKLAEKAIQHISHIKLADDDASRVLWTDCNYKTHLLSILSNWQRCHNQETEEASGVEFWIGQQFIKDGSVESAIQHFEYVSDPWNRRPATRPQLELQHKAELELAKAYLVKNRPEMAIERLYGVQQLRQILAQKPIKHKANQIPRQKASMLVLELGRELVTAYKAKRDNLRALEVLQKLEGVEPEGAAGESHQNWEIYLRRELVNAYLSKHSPKKVIRCIEGILGVENDPEQLASQTDLAVQLVVLYRSNRYPRKATELLDKLDAEFARLERVALTKRQIDRRSCQISDTCMTRTAIVCTTWIEVAMELSGLNLRLFLG